MKLFILSFRFISDMARLNNTANLNKAGNTTGFTSNRK